MCTVFDLIPNCDKYDSLQIYKKQSKQSIKLNFTSVLADLECAGHKNVEICNLKLNNLIYESKKIRLEIKNISKMLTINEMQREHNSKNKESSLYIWETLS